jgi:hypothetical protein
MMEYTISPFEANEARMFFRLDGVDAERSGAVGYLRTDFGRSGNEFHSTWFDTQTRLKTPAFRAEFDAVINALRETAFASRTEMTRYCREQGVQPLTSEGVNIPHAVGFKVQTEGFTHYFRLLPGMGDYDIRCFSYDNRYLLPELAGKHELPYDCLSIMPSSGAIIYIIDGEMGYRPFDKFGYDPATNRQEVDKWNSERGITRAQEEAMLGGSMFGWNTPAAKPWSYEQDGSPRILPTTNKDKNQAR